MLVIWESCPMLWDYIWCRNDAISSNFFLKLHHWIPNGRFLTYFRQWGFFFPFYYLEDISPFRGETDTPVKVGSSLPLFWTSGVTLADCIEFSMAAEPYLSTNLQICPQALVDVWDSNPRLSVQWSQRCITPGHSGSAIPGNVTLLWNSQDIYTERLEGQA